MEKSIVKKSRNPSRDARKAQTNGVPADVINDRTQNLTRRICQRLKELRKQRHWTLEELAAGSGVSRSMLSQIERNQVNPTVAILFRVAQALDRSLTDLMDEPNGESAIMQIRATDPAFRWRWDDACRCRTLYPLHLERDVEFYEVWLAPGGALRSAPHFTGTREIITVSKGRVALVSGKDRSEIEAPDSAYYPADLPHSIENVGAQDASFFLVVVCRSS
jgi:transcriptional regulator with XRE-family HTH domain